MKRSFWLTVLVGLASAGLAAVAASKPWVTVTVTGVTTRTVGAEGSDVAPLVLPLSLVVLACWGTVLVLRRRGRRVVAVLGLVAALTASVVTAAEAPDAASRRLEADGVATVTAWPWVGLAALAVSAAAFVVVLLKARGWPEMSSRYDAPQPTATAGEPVSGRELWQALDEGHDPTA